jgi:putative ABC transport system permease protein
VILGTTAALVGAVAGPAAVAAIAHRQAWPVAVDWPLILATAALAVELTVVAALLPARHAARLDPLTALRT